MWVEVFGWDFRGKLLKKEDWHLKKEGCDPFPFPSSSWGFSAMNEDLAAAASSYVDGPTSKILIQEKKNQLIF